MLQRKGKLKGKTKDTRLALFCIFAQILVSFVWGTLCAKKNKFQKISSFYKVVFYAQIALQRTPKQTPCGASLFFVVDVAENMRYSFSRA